jgi:MFS family permease
MDILEHVASLPAESDNSVSPGVFRWAIVAVLFVVSAINYADRSSITAVFPLLKGDLGFSDIGLGAIGSLFLWSYAFASPFAGYVGDRVNRTRVVIWSLAGWSLVTLLSGLATTQWQLLSMRCLLGIVEAMYLPAGMALVAEYHGARTRGTALGILSVGNYVGLLGGGTIGGYLGEHYGWRAPLCTLGAMGIAFAAGCHFLLPARGREVAGDQVEGEVHRREVRLSFGHMSARLFSIPSFVVLAIAGVLTSIGAWIFINWLPLYFSETFGMTLAGAGFFGSSLVPVSAALGQLGGGPLSDLAARGGLHRRMLMQAVLISCAAPTLLTFLVTRNERAVMVALVLYSIFRSCGDLNMIPLLCDLAGKDKQSTAFGITNMVNTIAGGLGVFVAGSLKARFGLGGIFAGVAGILMLDAALLFTGYVLFIRRDLRESGAVPIG